MVTEEVKRDKSEHPEGLYHSIGACRFCGQMTELETLFPFDEEQSHDAATEKCDCGSAIIWTRRRKNKKKAAEIIQKRFADEKRETFLPEEARNFINMSAELVVEDVVDKAVVHIGRIKVTASITKKGGIKIECVTTKKEVEET